MCNERRLSVRAHHHAIVNAMKGYPVYERRSGHRSRGPPKEMIAARLPRTVVRHARRFEGEAKRDAPIDRAASHTRRPFPQRRKIDTSPSAPDVSSFTVALSHGEEDDGEMTDRKAEVRGHAAAASNPQTTTNACVRKSFPSFAVPIAWKAEWCRRTLPHRKPLWRFSGHRRGRCR